MRKEIIKYDLGFKRTVISMLESGELKSMEEARRVFNIRGSSSISKWIKRMGREDLLPIIKMRRMQDEAELIKENDPLLYEKIIKHIQ